MGTELSGDKFPPDTHAEGHLACGNEFVVDPLAGSLQLCSMSQLFCQGEKMGTRGQVHTSALHNTVPVQESHSHLWARMVPARKFRWLKSNSCISWGKLEPLWPRCWSCFCCSGDDLLFRANLALLHADPAAPGSLQGETWT